MGILCVFGTRPEAIKMAPVVWKLRDRVPALDVRICSTAQHRDMLDSILARLNVRPDYDFDLMREDQSLTDLTVRLLTCFQSLFEIGHPARVLVQGDTTTAAMAALAAFYRRVPVAHIEAGLRTGMRDQPFPEEANRKLISSVADLHFAPTEQARANLLREGVDQRAILVTGNTAIDALNWALKEPEPEEVTRLSAGAERLLLVTVHRRESFGRPIEDVCLALKRIAEHQRGAIRIVFPVHPNPNVLSPVYRALGALPNVTLVPPVDYVTLVHLMKRSHLVLTDSGGLQEEAPSLGRPVLVLRDATERPEGIEAGTALLVGTDPSRIVAETLRLLTNGEAYRRMARVTSLYGDGHAAERIAAALAGTEVRAESGAASARNSEAKMSVSPSER